MAGLNEAQRAEVTQMIQEQTRAALILASDEVKMSIAQVTTKEAEALRVAGDHRSVERVPCDKRRRCCPTHSYTARDHRSDRSRTDRVS